MSRIRAAVVARLNDDEQVMFLEGAGFDRAIVGVIERFGQPRIVCYDVDKVLAVLKTAHGMSDDDAADWFAFNIVGAWMGDATPCFLQRV